MKKNEELPILMKHFGDMDNHERQAFQARVEEGEEVRADGLADRMKQAHLLAVATANDECVAV
jgi:hypothetical protein